MRGEDATLGGGIAIGIQKGIVFRDHTKTLPEKLQDQEILFIQAIHETFEAYLFNIYLPKPTGKR
jgi:hypothetical protein